MAAPRVVLDTNTVVMPLTRRSGDDWMREYWERDSSPHCTQKAPRLN